jgi:Fur family ferric uptake transcriptional regulator
MTCQRTAVVHVLVDCRDFVSAQELHALMSTAGKRIGLTTVYRTLRELETWGHADVVRDETGERLYRLRLAEGHRHYLLCRSCGHSRPVDSEVVEAWADRVATEAGFAAVEHTVELTGICARCVPASPATDEGDASCPSEPAAHEVRSS